MTKPKKTSVKKTETGTEKPDPNKKPQKKSYMVDDEDDELDLDDKEDDGSLDADADPDDADIVIPKTFDPFDDDDEDDDF